MNTSPKIAAALAVVGLSATTAFAFLQQGPPSPPPGTLCAITDPDGNGVQHCAPTSIGCRFQPCPDPDHPKETISVCTITCGGASAKRETAQSAKDKVKKLLK